jgi:predicted hotdog family 3-hydroxylacyl-ACP dehydratase
MLVEKKDIKSLIPQREPFVMIDELSISDDVQTKTRFEVREDNIFTENGMLNEAGLLENIAQTAAARAGYEATQMQGPVKIGYIGAVKNFEVFGLPQVGSVIETEITVGNQVFDVSLIRGTVRGSGQVLASCEMKIFIKNQ